MFIGIDHGTTAMRFAAESGEFRISREEAREFCIADLARLCPLEEIEGIAICYSMGDNISAITGYREGQEPWDREPRRGRQAYRWRDAGI